MGDKPHFFEHRKRLREKFLRTQGAGMGDYELLELLLTYAIPRRDVKPIAKGLIKRFGSIGAVLDAPRSELEKCPGMGDVSSSLILLIKELFVQYTEEEMVEKDALSTPDAVITFARTKMAGLHNETFLAIYVDIKNRVISYDTLSSGTVSRVSVFPRQIVEAVLSNHASGVILVHNHPSGVVRPSEEDIALTRSVVEATRVLDIRVIDHIIVGKNGHFSFVGNNLLPQRF
ncbi:MAG: DNA repair protein RadC [Candidatus Dadabacteria bacterium]|nr:DNA repair protein RadC [Candidatus Dadabacteria bacterium]